MRLDNLTLCVAIVCIFGGCAAFPVSETKDELNDIVASLIEDHEKQDGGAAQIAAEVGEDASEHDRKLGEAYEGVYAPEDIAKRAPWYSARDFYDGSKRFGGFDSINHYSNFGKFQKRTKGEPANVGENLVNRLKRAGFDSIHHFSNFGRFNKRSVNRAYFARGFKQPAWKRRGFDSIHHYSDFGGFSKRK